MRLARAPLAVAAVALAAAVAGRMAPVAAQDATPLALPATPAAAACTVEPRPLAFFEQFVGTPAPRPATPASRGMATTPAAFAMPAGQPADPATRATVTAAVLELAACINAGDRLRYYALFTDEFFRALVARAGPLPAEALAFLATPAPLPAQNRAALLAVVDVRTLAGGRVAALADVFAPDLAPPGPARLYWEFVEGDGRWLVDVQVTVGPIDSAQVGTPTP